MARLLADEQFPMRVTKRLRRLGHDVVRLQQFNQNKRGDGKSDPLVLKIAMLESRAVVTLNCKDFRALHDDPRFHGRHKGIIACIRDDDDPDGLARRIHDAIKDYSRLDAQYIEVPASQTKSRRKRQ